MHIFRYLSVAHFFLYWLSGSHGSVTHLLLSFAAWVLRPLHMFYEIELIALKFFNILRHLSVFGWMLSVMNTNLLFMNAFTWFYRSFSFTLIMLILLFLTQSYRLELYEMFLFSLGSNLCCMHVFEESVEGTYVMKLIALYVSIYSLSRFKFQETSRIQGRHRQSFSKILYSFPCISFYISWPTFWYDKGGEMSISSKISNYEAILFFFLIF